MANRPAGQCGSITPGGDAVSFEGHWHGHQNNELTLPSGLQDLELMSVNEDPVTWVTCGS